MSIEYIPDALATDEAEDSKTEACATEGEAISEHKTKALHLALVATTLMIANASNTVRTALRGTFTKVFTSAPDKEQVIEESNFLTKEHPNKKELKEEISERLWLRWSHPKIGMIHEFATKHTPDTPQERLVIVLEDLRMHLEMTFKTYIERQGIAEKIYEEFIERRSRVSPVTSNHSLNRITREAFSQHNKELQIKMDEVFHDFEQATSKEIHPEISLAEEN